MGRKGQGSCEKQAWSQPEAAAEPTFHPPTPPAQMPSGDFHSGSGFCFLGICCTQTGGFTLSAHVEGTACGLGLGQKTLLVSGLL